MRRSAFILLLIGLAAGLSAQVAPGKYVVEFTDKENGPYSIDRPWEFLSQRALDRRAAQAIPVTPEDLPLTPAYVQGVAAVGVTPWAQVKWLNALVIACTDPGLIAAVEALPYVKGVLKATAAGEPAQKDTKFEEDLAYEYGQGTRQIQMINGHLLHDQGFRGQGKVIAVLDAGFTGSDTIRTFDSLRADGRILGTANIVEPGATVYGWHPHGTMVLSVMAANLPGELVGTAPEASYWLIRTEDGASENLVEEYYWVAGAAVADSAGADVINSSLGYTEFDDTTKNHTCQDMDGNTTPVTRGANLAAMRNMLVVNSAGNSGATAWTCVSAPADGTGVLTIAAVDSNGVYAGFSSKGRIDGSYVKPNVAAQGAQTAVSWTDGMIVRSNGTSFSSPVIAGAAASYWSARPAIAATDLKRMIEQSGSHASLPDSLTGFGIPDFSLMLAVPPAGMPGEERIRILPNPVSGPFTVQFVSKEQGQGVATIWSSDGKMVFQSDVLQIRKGENRTRISFPESHPAGLYLIRITNQANGRTLATGKFEKTR